MMLPVSWQIGCDFCLASTILRSMIFMADSAIVPFFSCSNELRMAVRTSSGISAEVRLINSTRESWSELIKLPHGRKRPGRCQPGRSADGPRPQRLRRRRRFQNCLAPTWPDALRTGAVRAPGQCAVPLDGHLQRRGAIWNEFSRLVKRWAWLENDSGGALNDNSTRPVGNGTEANRVAVFHESPSPCSRSK